MLIYKATNKRNGKCYIYMGSPLSVRDGERT
jgi:hypothetical protein